MSERKAVSTSELVDEAELLAPKLVEFSSTHMLGGLLGLYIAARAVERLIYQVGGEQMREEVDQLKAMDLAAAEAADALAKNVGMPSAGGKA